MTSIRPTPVLGRGYTHEALVQWEGSHETFCTILDGRIEAVATGTCDACGALVYSQGDMLCAACKPRPA